MEEESYNQLKELKNFVGLTTIADVVKLSIALFKWAVDKQKDGFEIYAVPTAAKKEEGVVGEKVQVLLPL